MNLFYQLAGDCSHLTVSYFILVQHLQFSCRYNSCIAYINELSPDVFFWAHSCWLVEMHRSCVCSQWVISLSLHIANMSFKACVGALCFIQRTSRIPCGVMPINLSWMLWCQEYEITNYGKCCNKYWFKHQYHLCC